MKFRQELYCYGAMLNWNASIDPCNGDSPVWDQIFCNPDGDVIEIHIDGGIYPVTENNLLSMTLCTGDFSDALAEVQSITSFYYAALGDQCGAYGVTSGYMARQTLPYAPRDHICRKKRLLRLQKLQAS